MKTIFKQATFIIICSIVIGMSFNYFIANVIPIIAKPIKEFSNNSQINEFVIEIIDLEIAKKFFNDDMLFIDARDDISFIEGHITGAISSIPYDDSVDNIFINQGFSEPIVIYCDDKECGLSEELGYRLQAEGFSKIYVFSGGWNQWLMAKLPVEK